MSDPMQKRIGASSPVSNHLDLAGIACPLQFSFPPPSILSQRQLAEPTARAAKQL